MKKIVLYYPEICIEEIYDTVEELVEKLTERIEDGSYKDLGYIDIQEFDVEKGKWTKK